MRGVMRLSGWSNPSQRKFSAWWTFSVQSSTCGGVSFLVPPLFASILHPTTPATSLWLLVYPRGPLCRRARGSSTKFAGGLPMFDPRRVAPCMLAVGSNVSFKTGALEQTKHSYFVVGIKKPELFSSIWTRSAAAAGLFIRQPGTPRP